MPAELLAEDVVGFAKGFVHVAPGEDTLVHDVSAALFDDERAVGLQGSFSIDDRRQRLVGHVDQLQRVLRYVPADGGDSGHRFAHEADLVRG